MVRFLLCDLKRIFSSRATIVLCIIIPFIVMLLFASVIAPLLITRTRVAASCFVICNDDGTDITKEFINYVANSKAFKGVVYISAIDTVAKGQELIARNEVSGMLYIPKNFYSDLSNGKNVRLEVFGDTFHTLECSLVLVAVESALNTAGRAQNALAAVRDYAVSLGADGNDAQTFYDKLLDLGIRVVTDRKAVLGQDGFISPAGDYLPAELCLSAMLAWFLALATLPLASFSGGDFSMSVLHRGMRTRGMRLKFLAARLISGALFLLLVTLMIFPIGIGASNLDRLFSGNIAALFASMGLMAVSFSALSLGLSAWMPNSDAAVWIGFWLIVIFAMVGGAILPDSMLPAVAKSIGLWSPVRAAMRLFASAIFKFSAQSFQWDMVKMGIWGIFGIIAAGAGFMRRAAV